jgi:hemerythrin-like domain-containing protein
MSHDNFENERFRLEQVLAILERAVTRIEEGGNVPTTVLQDAVAFLMASEDAAYEETQVDDSEPTLSACLAQITEGRQLLTQMHKSAAALADGDVSAAVRFAQQARQYIRMSREHLRLDDRLFARVKAGRRALDGSDAPVASVETADTRRLYDRLIEASAVLDIGVPTAFPVHGH